MSFVADQVRAIDLQLDRLHLEHLSVVLPTALAPSAGPDSEPTRELSLQAPLSHRINKLQAVIKSLSSTSSTVLTAQQIISLLSLADISITTVTDNDGNTISTQQEQEAYLEHELSWLIVSKAAIQTYGVILSSLVDETLPLSDDIYYWDEVLSSYRYTLLYSLQTSPWRLYSFAKEVYHDAKSRLERRDWIGADEIQTEAAGLSETAKRFYGLVKTSLRERSLSSLNARFVSPFALITHAIHQKHANISKLRSMQASALGVIMNEGLTFESEDDKEDWKGVVERSVVLMENVVKNVCNIHQVGGVEQFEDLVFTGSSNGVAGFDDVPFADGDSAASGLEGGGIGGRRGSNLGVSITSLTDGKKDAVIPYVLSVKLQEMLQKHLPKQEQLSKEILRENGRPSVIVRYWIPLTALFFTSGTIFRVLVNRREFIQTWVREAGETIIDFWANWVVDPLKRIIGTIRTGEDQDVALMSRESLISDRESLERMVVDFAIDNPATSLDNNLTAAALTPQQIEIIRENVKQGDLTPVLKVYEQDLKKPIRGAVTGELLRSLLIQIQKTKVDLEVAVSGIDNMLKSQQLLFGMLGLTPGVLIVVGTTRYVNNAWGDRSGFKKSDAKGRMIRILRHIDRILSTSAAYRATEGRGQRSSTLTFKEHGLLLCEVHVLRELAGYVLPRGVVMKEFLEDMEEMGSIKNGHIRTGFPISSEKGKNKPTIMQNTTADNTVGVPPAAESAAATAARSSPHQIIILGAGIIGLSTAYYLSSPSSTSTSSASSQHSQFPSLLSPQQITVLDTSPTLFACASGRAGGFLAKDWFSHASSALGDLSFRLHRELADANNGRKHWGYTRSTSLSLASKRNGETGEQRRRGDDWLRAGTSRVDASYGSSEDTKTSDSDDIKNAAQRRLAPDWLNANGGEVELSSTGDTTAQVDPRDLCRFLLKEVRQRGVDVRHPVTPLRITQTADGELEGLVVVSNNSAGTAEDEEVLPCSHILISAGPWSDRVFQRLFPKSSYQLPITSLAGHHIILRSPLYQPQQEAVQETETPLDCNAVFASISGVSWHPEFFTRVNGDIYFAGVNSSKIPLPAIATEVKEKQSDIKELIDLAEVLVNQGGNGGDIVPMRSKKTSEAVDVIATGLCHRPVTPAGNPILARVPDTVLGGVKTKAGGNGGVFVSAGHGPWGTSQSLGTGKVMAELMMGELLSADISQLGLQ
ncbi:hypothetical protein H072_3249 [Dactylellina haptotyla CBS 200.50]|uniref:FAD dependent oxidoreductase domain-containing protein n=1 Tax=Dactylellina haptotyla (strain CBS 200.50) TaxID=1284197 RepID=S8AIQ9_DACHA|nr:hypothetical protein H072_3249 [Dactylellina haptotyla CBS 200.50]